MINLDWSNLKKTMLAGLGSNYTKLASRIFPSSKGWVKEFILKAGAPGIKHWANNRIVSYPKCGRTWLRILLGKVFHESYAFPEKEIVYSRKLTAFHPHIPAIVFEHEDMPHRKKPEKLSTNKKDYHTRNVIFLVRDPRDVIVSSYHHESNRRFPKEKRYDGKMSEFIRAEKGGFRSIIRYYNIWLRASEKIDDFLLVKYEDFQKNTKKALKKVLLQLNFRYFTENNLEAAVRYADFDHMKKMEEKERFDRIILQPGDQMNQNSYKTRKGKVGGFREELDEKDISYMNEIMKKRLIESLDYMNR